jgi:type III restriction enzyme
MIIGDDLGFRLPKQIKIKPAAKILNCSNGQSLQRSLFDFVAEEELNETEKAVAWYLESQDKLFFWYRNRAKADYAIQGWRKQKIYPDFIFTETDAFRKGDYDKVFVVETKGVHLKNEDTDYKKSVFEVCNNLAKQQSLSKLGIALKNNTIDFEVVFEDEWERRLNGLFGD